MDDFPPIVELLPHRGRAVLLAGVLAHDRTTTVCSVEPAASLLYRDGDGNVPAYVGLEYMAEAVAAHGGLLDREEGRRPRPGFFVGSRRLVFTASAFGAGDRLEVTARHLRGTHRLLAFDCEVRLIGTSQAMVSGVLTVYLLDSFEALAADFSGDGPAL